MQFDEIISVCDILLCRSAELEKRFVHVCTHLTHVEQLVRSGLNAAVQARILTPWKVLFISEYYVACTGNLCFGKCGILHCSLWGVQTIHFLYTQHGMFNKHT